MAIKQRNAGAVEGGAGNTNVVKETMLADVVYMPKWDAMLEAVIAGHKRIDEALDLAGEARLGHHNIIQGVTVQGTAQIPTYIADQYGEEYVGKFWRWMLLEPIKEFLDKKYSIEEMLWLDAEDLRLYDVSNIVVKEETERFVLTYDTNGIPQRQRNPQICGVTKQAWPWSWGKTGMPYSCAELAVKWEILPTELQGYPIRINLISEAPDGSDTYLYYKKPELIPEEYFTRIGMRKTIF